MKYTVITNVGRIYTFYSRTVAETYARAYRGTLVDLETIVEETV